MKIPQDKFENWLVNKNLKERTIQNYIYYFNKFTSEVFNQESISRFLSIKSNRNDVARGFIVNYKKFLLVNYIELGITPELKTAISLVELPVLSGRAKRKIIRPISRDDIFLLEKHLETEREKIQLVLSYFCGLRVGELLRITIISFNWDEWKKDPSKIGECIVLGKGSKEGLALVPSDIMQRIAVFIHAQNFSSVNSYLFCDPDKEFKFMNLARQWQLKLAEAGIKSGICKTNDDGSVVKATSVHPHRLRHSYASYLLNVVGLGIREVQELLRHSSIQSTQIYTHISKGQLKDKLSNFNRKEGS